MDSEEKQLIGSILSEESEVFFQERKQTRKKSKLSLNAKEFQPTIDSHSKGIESGSFNSTNTYMQVNERQKEKKVSIKLQPDINQLNFSPRKHSTMQPIQPSTICYLSFNSNPSLQEENQIQLQLQQQEIQFRHCLEQLCGNQNVSRNLQKIFDNGSPLQKRLIYEAIEKNLIKISKDLFGNYLVQKIFQLGEIQWKFNLFYQFKGHIVELSKNQYSSRVINRMIEFLKNEDYHLQIEFMEEIKTQIRQLINDNNGCFVILSCLENFDFNICEFMKRIIENSVYQMSQHTYGCRIIQFMLQKQQSNSLLQIIMEISQQLCICEFGNYIIQFILKSNFKQQKFELIQIIKNNFQTLSYNKYGSNVVEVFLDVIEGDDIKFITNLMLTTQQDDNYIFLIFATHPFANYVFKKYLQLEQQHIMPVLQILKKSSQLMMQINQSEFGQKIYPIVERSIQFI